MSAARCASTGHTILCPNDSLGQGLGLPVIAEGVETKEQLAFLAEAKCDCIQGFLIGRPQPIAHYAEIVGKPALPVMKPKIAKVG